MLFNEFCSNKQRLNSHFFIIFDDNNTKTPFNKFINKIEDSEFEKILIESKELEKIFAASAITAKKNL